MSARGDYIPNLLPCPFCGGEANYQIGIDPGDTWGARLFIGCESCDIRFWGRYRTDANVFDDKGCFIREDVNQKYSQLLTELRRIESIWNRRTLKVMK